MQQKANAGKPITKLMQNIDRNEAERQELQAEKSRIYNWAAWHRGESKSNCKETIFGLENKDYKIKSKDFSDNQSKFDALKQVI